MVQRTLRSSTQLMVPVDSPEQLVLQLVGVLVPNNEQYRPARRNENTLEQGHLLTNLLDRDLEWMDTTPSSLIDDRVALEVRLVELITRSEDKRMMEFMMAKLVDKLETRIAQNSEESLIATVESSKTITITICHSPEARWSEPPERCWC